jgi:hypothetical protein
VALRFRKDPRLEIYRYQGFDLPLLIMGTLSLSYFHAFLTRIPLPLLRSERVATRFIVLPLILLIILASLRLNAVLQGIRQTVKLKIAAIVGIAVMSLGFVDHSYLWSVVRLERIFRNRTVDLVVPDIISIRDPSYKSLLMVSSVVSAVSVVLLLYLALRRRRDGDRTA